MRRNFIVYIFMIISSGSLFAQQNQGTVSGSLSDSITKQPLALATISIYKATDSALFTYRLSDPTGNFKISQLPTETELRMIITFSGFKPFRKDFLLKNGQSSESFGKIIMIPDARSLDEVLVFSERPPVVIKNDTIEFNASAFKTLPTALVEDLLKKLPGVEIDQDGNIVVNGRPVSRITVDGKDFFGGDPKVATRNLPANIIDKVQVTDDKKELERNPLLMKNELSQVINLKLKKSIKKGWFGKAYAGSGTNTRNEAGAIINSFRDTLQISGLAYTNNLNRGGFSADELFNLGGFKRTGVNSMMMTSSGGIGLNGISFGGFGDGILRSSGGGVNLNYSAKKNFNINLMYFTGTSISVNQINQITIQNVKDTIFIAKDSISNKGSNPVHRFGSKIEWTIDSLTNFWFKPAFIVNNVSSISDKILHAEKSTSGKQFQSINKERITSHSYQYSHELFFGRRQVKYWPGIVLYSKLDINNGQNDKISDVMTVFYPNSLSSLNQLQQRPPKNITSLTTLNLMRNLAKTYMVNLSNSLTTILNEDRLRVYELNNGTGKYEIYNPTLSNRVKQSGIKNATALTITNITKSGNTLIAGLSLNYLSLNNQFEKYPIVKQHCTYLFPRIGIYLKNGINITYSASVKEPAPVDLQPIIDNSNPVFQVFGNPELMPAVSRNISINKNLYKKDKLLSVNLYFDASIQKNGLIRERWINADGVQFTRPLNKSGIVNLNQWLSVRKQYKLSKNRSFSWNAGNSLGFIKSYALVNKLNSTQHNLFINPSVSISFNWQDKIEISQSFNYSWNHTSYLHAAFKTTAFQIFQYKTDIVIRIPKKVAWETNFDYVNNNDITPGFGKVSMLWNAAVNYQFLKDNKAILKLSAFDILNHNKSITRVVKENYTRDIEQSVLTRYFLLTFTYNIRDFKVRKIGGKESFFLF